MSAQHIYDTAPLGALVRYSNGEPQPPARFKRKLKAWERENGTGRLIKKEPGVVKPTYSLPPSITLHSGDYGTADCIVLTVHLTFNVTNPLSFSVIDLPKVGMARVVTVWEDVDEMRHLAPDLAAAEAWLASHHWPNARIEICVSDAGEFAPASARAA
jgi:hypothetical protein